MGLCDDQHIPVRILWTVCPEVPALGRVSHSTRTGGGSTVAVMSNESTTPGPAEQPRPSLPQFDPTRQDILAVPTSAPTSELPVAPPSTPYTYAGMPAPEGTTPLAGPSVPLAATGLPQRPSPATGVPSDAAGRWSAKKTAVTAGLAIVLASAGAIGAAAAMPAGSTGGDSFRGPGGGRSFQFPGGNGQGGFGRQNQQLPNQQGQLPNLQNSGPGGALGGVDPNQLSQLDPQDLLNQLNQLGQGVDPFSGGPGGGPGSGSSQGSGAGSDDAKTT